MLLVPTYAATFLGKQRTVSQVCVSGTAELSERQAAKGNAASSLAKTGFYV